MAERDYYIIMQQQRENPFISNLLRKFEHDESEATREVLDKLAASAEHRHDYLSTFNLLLNTRNSQTRQRRDVAAIARLIADSDLFARLEPAIAEEARESRSTEAESAALQATKLIGNICNENPHFIDNILASSSTLLDMLFTLYSHVETTPSQAEGLSAVLGFLHNISLKESNVREKVGPCLEALLQNVLTHDKFSAFISQKKFQNFVNSLFKFHANVSLVATHAYHSLIRAARSLNQEYKRLAESYKIASQRMSTREERTLVLERAQFADRKLIAIMKLFERAKPGLFAKLSAFSFTGLLKILVKIAIMRPVALLAQPLQNKLLITLINDLMLSIQDHHTRLLAHHPLPTNNPPAAEIQEEEGELQPPVEQEKLASSPGLLERLRCQARSFQTISQVSKHFSDTYFRIIQTTIQTLLVSFQTLKFSQIREGFVADAVVHSRFLIGILTVRLQRILSWMIKLFPLDQLRKGTYYRQIVTLLLKLIPYYFQSAADAQNTAILEQLINMTDVTTESQNSAMRYIMETLEQQCVKTFIQGKLLQKINIFSTAYEIIIKFVYHLTDDQDALRHNVAVFIHPFLQELQKNHLDSIRAAEKLSFRHIQVLRLALKVVTEFMHGGANPNLEEQKKQRIRIYRYCRLILTGEGIFCFFADILNLLEKHRIEDTAQLLDTIENRELVTHTIFAKIAIQRAKTFANALTHPHAVTNSKLSPDFKDALLEEVKQYYTDTYQGYFGYLRSMSQLIKRSSPGTRHVPFKEEILGTVLSRTLEYGLFVEDTYGNCEELAVHEAGLVKSLKKIVDGEAEGLMHWLFQAANQHIHRLPLMIKKILHFEKRELRGVLGFDEVVHQQQVKHVEAFILSLSEQFTRSSLLLTGKRPDLKVKVKKTWKVQEIDIAGQVQRVCNLIVMLGELLRLLVVEGCFQPSQPQITPNYFYSVLNLVQDILQRYDAEHHFPVQADSLLHASLWLVEMYLLYHTQLKDAAADRYKEAKEQRKMMRRERKERLKTEKAEEHSLVPSKKKKKTKKKRLRKCKRVEEAKGLARSGSKNDLLQRSQAKQRAVRKKQKRGQLQQSVRKYLSFVVNLLGGASALLIRNETLSYLLYFISRHMHRSMVQNPPYHQFQISLAELIAPLLRVKVKSDRIPGYHLTLCKLALQLFDEAHIRVDYELAIKRYLHQHSDQKLTIIKFEKMLRENFRAISPSTAALVEITYPDDPKRDQFVPSVYVPLLQIGARTAYIEAKQGVQLHLITRPDPSPKRKPSGHQQKLLKVSDYCPEGELFVFVEQVIAHSIRTVIAELDRGFAIEDLETLHYSKDMEPFTIRAALQTLQYLARESPSLGPFIAKFKCRKILQTELIAQGLKNKEKVSGMVQRLLTGQAQGELQEIGFLSVLLRLFSPLMANAISGLLFQLCLDSTPLVQVVESKERPGKTSYLPFGSVVRLKVAEEVDHIIFGFDQPLYRRLCLLNLVTVVINIREMSKLLLENSFVAKLYKGLEGIRAELGELTGNFVTRLLSPFYHGPIGILQELNIHFQYLKKIGKGAPKISIKTVLSRESINEQLIPLDSLKRFKFKLDWPYSIQRENPLQAHEEHDEHSLYAEANSQGSSSLSQQSYESFDSEDNSSYMRYSQLQQHMPDSDQFNQYISQEPHEQLLNQEWQYSDSPNQYPIDDDNVIEIDQAGPEDQDDYQQGEDAGEEEIDDYLQGVSQGYLDEESEQGMEQRSMSLIHGLSMSSLSQATEDLLVRTERDFTMNEVKQEDYYLNVNAILNFQKVDCITRISKVEKRQVHLLRFFLQVITFSLRKAYDIRFPRILTQHEIKQEKLVEECLDLAGAFRLDELIRLAEFVQYNQMYRYDHLHKQTPLLSQEVERQFTDQADPVRQNFRRRGGFINSNRDNRQNLIQILPGWNITEVINEEPGNQPMDNYDSTPQRPLQDHDEEGQMIRIDSQEGVEADEQGMEEDGMEIMDQMEDEELDEEQHIANIQEILRTSNLGMTTREFMRLDPEIQHDILLNIAQQQPEEAPNNTPIRSPPLPLLQVPPLNLREHLREIESLSSGRVVDNGLVNSHRPAQEMEEEPSQQAEEIVPEAQAEEALPQQPVEIDPNAAHLVDEVYRKMSLQHSKKITKDVIEALNKDGKNNSKFYELQESDLQSLLAIFFLTNDVEHSKYPYPLVETICINTHNLKRLLSNLVLLLHLTPQRFYYRPGHNVLKIAELESKDAQKQDYAEKIYPRLVLKILHLLTHLTRNYSIAMALLRVNCQVTASLNIWERPEQSEASSFQLLIFLSRERAVSESPMVLSFLIGVLDNVTMHHFYKNVHKIVAEKSEGQEREEFKVGEESVNLLGELLQSDFVGDNLALVSKIIMRLSVQEENLRSFIRYLEQLVRQLTDLALKEVMSQTRIEGLGKPKIINLMAIFYEMVKAFQTYPTSLERHLQVLGSLRRIVEYDQLQVLCEQAVRVLFAGNGKEPYSRVGEVVDCFFVLYEIATITSGRGKKQTDNEAKHNRIAELGEVGLAELRRSQVTDQEDLVLGAFNLSKLWKESAGHPNFKLYVNDNIQRKLAEAAAHPRRASVFDMPIIKIAAATPHLLSFDNKYALFKAELRRLRGKDKAETIHISLRREDVFEDSFQSLFPRSVEQLRGKLKIQFRGEEGEDAGGVTRQWFQLLSREMFNANYGLFKSGSGGHTYHPSPTSYFNERHLDYFKFIGRVAGKALYDGYLLDAYFTPAFYKHILHLPITYRDMEQQDYEYFKSLTWILENSPIDDFLELNFTYDCDNFGEIQTRELIPGGAGIIVTEQNKLQYVQLIAYAKMATSIRPQLEAFLTGLHELVPHRLLSVFSEKQLEIMISGRPTIDIQDLRRHTDLVNYMRNDPIIVWLFEVLQAFDMELRTAFIQFVTGSSRVPVQGFKDLRGMSGVQRFNIHREFQEDRLPRAHTCFNQLDLPNYRSKEMLIQKLMYAITEGREGFGMI